MPYGVTKSYVLTKKQHREFLCVFVSVCLFIVSTEQLLRHVFIAGRHCDMGMVLCTCDYVHE